MELSLKVEKFKEKIKEIYPEDAEQIISDINTPREKSFRIIDLSREELILNSLKSQGFEFKESFMPNVYIITKNPTLRLSETVEYEKGLIYIQELSSMIPVVILEPSSGENILDLCAAPGSKTIQIANIVSNEANIIAVEKNKFRFFKLKSNLEKYNANAKVLLEDGANISNTNPQFINFFDKVLVDAPCSSEGQLCLCNLKAFGNWNTKRAKIMAKQQRKLLLSGIEMLKPGGTLIYSTCTLSVEENEGVLDWVLRQGENIKIERIHNANLNIPNIEPGFTSWKGKAFDQQIMNALRIVPTKEYGGFFVAKLRKV